MRGGQNKRWTYSLRVRLLNNKNSVARTQQWTFNTSWQIVYKHLFHCSGRQWRGTTAHWCSNNQPG